MTPEQRLELLDDLKAKEGRTVRRARVGAWASVIVAGCVTALLLFLSYNELRRVNAEVGARRAELDQMNKQLEQARRQLENTQTRLRAWQNVVSEIPKPELEASFARASRGDPSVERILARVYIQRPPGAEALKRAEEARQRLRQAGFVVPGIEVRPEAVRQTEVRYYKSEDAAQAAKVADVLRSIGERVGAPKHLERFENSTAVRPNHYEVWLGATTGGRPRPRPAR
jgi:hypothetical protein